MFQDRIVKFRIVLTLFILYFICPVATCFADDIVVTASVDKTEASLEDSISLTVKVSGTQNSPTPEIPPMPEFRVQSLGSSSSVQIINTKMTSSVSFNYRLTPVKWGSFTLPPFTATIKGKTYATEPIAVHIKEASVAIDPETAVFAQSTVSNLKPYVNEQVTLTLKLFRKVDVKNINLNASYDNFRKEDLGKEREYTQVVDGINYNVLELSVALFPTKSGVQEIPPAVLDLDILRRTRERRPMNDPFAHFFDDSFLFGGRVQTEHKTLRTHPIELKVQPLPETGKPEDFSNLVGQFTISAELGKNHVEVGDSITLTATISGKGNIKDIPEPKLNVQNKFKIYPDQPETRQEIVESKISGKKTFKFALVPMQEGENIIPPIPLTYFDPEQKKYVTQQTQPLSILVNPSTAKESLNFVEAQPTDLTNKPIKLMGKDILPIHTNISDFEDHRFTPAKSALYAASLILPIMLFFVSAFYLQFKRRLQFDVAYSRNRTAYKLARKQLATLSAPHNSDPKELAQELSKILREYIGNKLNLQGTAFTPGEISGKIKEMKNSGDLVQRVAQLLEKYETLQYSPNRVNGDLTQSLLTESTTVLDQIEKQL